MIDEADIPDGYELTHHDPPGLFDEERGVIITVHERDRITREVTGKYRWRVIGAQNQKGFYDGSFESREAAVAKQLELAREH